MYWNLKESSLEIAVGNCAKYSFNREYCAVAVTFLDICAGVPALLRMEKKAATICKFLFRLIFCCSVRFDFFLFLIWDHFQVWVETRMADWFVASAEVIVASIPSCWWELIESVVLLVASDCFTLMASVAK